MLLPSMTCQTRDKQSNLGGCTCLPMALEAMPQVRAGELSPEQLRHSSGRDIFLRALGNSEENNPFPDFTMRDVRAGDVLVLCSDGLWSALTEEQLAHIVSTRPSQQACEELVRL